MDYGEVPSSIPPPPCAPRSSEQGGRVAGVGELQPAGLRAGPGGQAGLGLACPGLAQASKRLDFLRIFKVLRPQTLKFFRRASRAGNASFS